MYAVFRIGHFPSESDSETMLKVLKWGVVPLNLKGHDMTPHSLCWVSTNGRRHGPMAGGSNFCCRARALKKSSGIERPDKGGLRSELCFC